MGSELYTHMLHQSGPSMKKTGGKALGTMEIMSKVLMFAFVLVTVLKYRGLFFFPLIADMNFPPSDLWKST